MVPGADAPGAVDLISVLFRSDACGAQLQRALLRGGPLPPHSSVRISVLFDPTPAGLSFSGPCFAAAHFRLTPRFGSVLLVLDEGVVVVVAVRSQGGVRVEAGRAVLEGQAHLDQLGLDL